jgi:hypothetical protein
MIYVDQRLTCPDCSLSFVFSAEAQGLSNELGQDAPIRCRTCRQSLENRRRFAAVDEYRQNALDLTPLIAATPGRAWRN